MAGEVLGHADAGGAPDHVRMPVGPAVNTLVIGSHSPTLQQGIERGWDTTDLETTRIPRAEKALTGTGISRRPEPLRAVA